MKATVAVFLLALAIPCFGQSNAHLKPVTVKIEATELDKAMLLSKLNEHGKDHGLSFDAVDKGYEYRIVFATGQKKNIGLLLAGAMAINYSNANVAAFDAKGTELFQFRRANRYTDSGAANAASKEIIKRLLRLWKLESKTQPNGGGPD